MASAGVPSRIHRGRAMQLGPCLALLASLLVGARAANAEGVYARANWLHGIQSALFTAVKREFKTRYDGSIWAEACRAGTMANRLRMRGKQLKKFLFDELNGRRDIGRIKPVEKWVLVNAVAAMTESYLEGAKAFVKPSRGDCKVVLRGLRREFR